MTRESALMAIGLSGMMLGTTPIRYIARAARSLGIPTHFASGDRVQPSKTAIQGPRFNAIASSLSQIDPTYHERAARTLYVGGVDSKVFSLNGDYVDLFQLTAFFPSPLLQ